ncbi:MAG: hypothetical protein JWM77_329 [Rhodospirillales bacterium]|nr:hypothetical protein [Rhodospirillales bacterium]
MKEDRIPIAPADPRPETVKPARDQGGSPGARSDEAKATGGGEEIRLDDVASRGAERDQQAAKRGEGGAPGTTSPGRSGTTGEPWTDAERARRR